MGEIDTKPIESVQSAITFFGQSNELRKNSPTNDKEVEREREMESLERELASVKVQLEVKDAAHKQALLKVDHYHKASYELSTLLKNSDLKKNFYIEESRKSSLRATELESALEETLQRLSEHEITREQLVHAQEELALLNEAKLESSSRAEATERLLNEEKLRAEELSRRVAKMNESILRIESENSEILHDLNDQIMQKSALLDSLQLEINDLRDLSARIGDLEAEIRLIRIEAESTKAEAEKAREQENEAQVEIALLKFEVHKGRSKLAAAEAAEARAQSEKSALYNALQQMGLEAEEIKRENKILKEEASRSEDRGPLQVEEEPDKEVVISKVEEVEEKEIRGEEEVEEMKRELEAAFSKIGELRTRAEQAMSRAKAAEKAKAALEEDKRKRRKHKEKRRAALEALRQESISREFEIGKNDDDDDDNGSVKSYQPLSKVLNMKF